MTRVERCAWADVHVRCARAAVRGRFCKAHAPKNEKRVRVECGECSGLGTVADDGELWTCNACCGTGVSTVPQVLVRYSGRDRG